MVIMNLLKNLRKVIMLLLKEINEKRIIAKVEKSKR